MAGEHILEQPKADKFRTVMHFDMPGGNNSANVSWADVLDHAGISKKTMLQRSTKTMVDSGEVDEEDNPIMVEVETVGVGQIGDEEYAEIMAGTKIELVGILKLDGDPSVEAINVLSQRYWSTWSAKMVERYRYYGHTQE